MLKVSSKLGNKVDSGEEITESMKRHGRHYLILFWKKCPLPVIQQGSS